MQTWYVINRLSFLSFVSVFNIGSILEKTSPRVLKIRKHFYIRRKNNQERADTEYIKLNLSSNAKAKENYQKTYGHNREKAQCLGKLGSGPVKIVRHPKLSLKPESITSAIPVV
jgi:hypothetical protein